MLRTAALVLPVVIPLAVPAAAQIPTQPQVDRGGAMARLAPTERRPLSAAEAKALVGFSALTRDGQPAGTIADFTLSGPDGRIERVVLSSGGLFGWWATLTLVPVEALRIDAPSELAEPAGSQPMTVLLDLAAGELGNAPTFSYGEGAPTLSGRR